MKSWRAANLIRLRMPVDTVLSGVPELVTLFDSGRSKVEQAARVVCGDMERLEARTQVSLAFFGFSLRFFLFSSRQWGRDNAPTGCSPRESGGLIANRSESLGGLFLLHIFLQWGRASAPTGCSPRESGWLGF